MPIEGDGEANTLEGTNGDDVINAYGGDDTIYASMGDDVIDGGDGGGDWLVVGARNPARFTQAGSQTYVITAGTVTSSSGSMNTSFSGIEILSFNNSGTSFGDTIDASSFQSSSDALFLLRILAGDGNDTITGSAESDAIYANLGRNTVDAGAGFDLVSVRAVIALGQTVYVTASGGAVQTMVGGVVTNTITNAEQVWVQAEYTGGTVRIDASGLVGFNGFLLLGDNYGTDILIGSPGNDIFVNYDSHTVGRDVYTGNGGADTFEYTYAVDGMDGDTITDFDWDDIIDLSNNGEAEVAMGYELADTFIGNAAFSGTAGEYRYEIVGNTTIVQVDHSGDGIADETLTIANGAFELAETAPGSNLLQIAGERVVGSDSEDTLTGSEVIDILNGLAGADRMIGLGGNDIYYVDNSGDLAVEAASEGIDSVYSSVSFTLGENVENLTLTDAPTASGGSALEAAEKDDSATNSEQPSGSGALNGFGNALDNVIQGNSLGNTLGGGDGNDTLSGGLGNDTLIGGNGTDTMTGGGGRDSFSGTASELNGDTITDFSRGDRIVISDADLGSFEYSLSGSVLSYSGGSLTLSNGVTGPFVVSAAPEGGVQLMLAPPTRATLTLTQSGQDYVIGGDVHVYGTTAGGEVIEILSGDIVLDASFNIGGDTIILPGSAASYTATRSGSFVIIEGGDVTIAIPVGAAGLSVQFADSTRTLRFDTSVGQVVLGDQAVTATPAQVEVAGAPLVEAVVEGPGGQGRLVLAEPGQDIAIGGNVSIFGSTAPGEVVTILHGNVTLDASFNVGGDTVSLPGDAGSYTAIRSGSFVTIAGEGLSVAIPVGTAGLTVAFADADRTLRFDTTSGQVVLGTQPVTSTAEPVEPVTDSLNLDGDIHVSADEGLIAGFEAVVLGSRRDEDSIDGHSYWIDLDDDNAPSVGNLLTIDASALAADTDGGGPLVAEQLILDASAVTSYFLYVAGGAASDYITVGQGNQSISAGGGADQIYVGSTLTDRDFIDGGEQQDTLHTSGALADVQFTNVTDVYRLYLDSSSVLGIEAAEAGIQYIEDRSGGAVTIDLSNFDRMVDAWVAVEGLAGADTFILGADPVIVAYEQLGGASSSLATGQDTIVGFRSGIDSISAIYVEAAQHDELNFVGNFSTTSAADGALVAGDGMLDIVFDQSTQTVWFDLDDNGNLDSTDLSILLPGVTSLQDSDVWHGEMHLPAQIWLGSELPAEPPAPPAGV